MKIVSTDDIVANRGKARKLVLDIGTIIFYVAFVRNERREHILSTAEPVLVGGCYILDRKFGFNFYRCN